MFNLKSLAIAAIGNMPVRDAAGEVQTDEAGNPLTITLYSPASKQYQKAKHAAEQRNNARVMAVMQNKGDEKLSAEDSNNEKAEFLAAITQSFNGFGYQDMVGYEGFKAAYADIEIGHIADDARKFSGDRANFLIKPFVS